MAKKWYVLHTYSGYENKVKVDLEHRIETYGIKEVYEEAYKEVIKLLRRGYPIRQTAKLADVSESTVKKALESLPFVLNASASHESGTVTLTLAENLTGTTTVLDADLVVVATPTNYDPELDFFDTSSVVSLLAPHSRYSSLVFFVTSSVFS